MVHVAFWIGFGALVGWIAAILQATTDGKHQILFVVAGAIGGVFGGLGGLALSGDMGSYSLEADGLTFALFGAAVAVVIATAALARFTSRSD